MSGDLAPIISISPDTAEADDRLEQWQLWLAGKINPDWRPGEWDPQSWLFSGDVDNPATVAFSCRTAGCNTILRAKVRCRECERAFETSGMSAEEFDATYQRRPARHHVYNPPSQCIAGGQGKRCARWAHTRGICRTHYSLWQKAWLREGLENNDANLTAWAETVTGYDALPECLVAGCEHESNTSASLCPTHYDRWRRELKTSAPVTAEQWARKQVPYLTGARFSLAALEPVARLEMLFALQARDARGGKIAPHVLRAITSKITDVTSLVLAPAEQLAPEIFGVAGDVHAFLREAMRNLRSAFDDFNGIDPTERNVWDLVALGIASEHGGTPRRNEGMVDFTPLAQPWLRKVAMEWARTTRPKGRELVKRLFAATIASRALSQRPGGGMEPSALQFADMTAVADGFRTLMKDDGSDYTNKYRATLLSEFCMLLEFGRQAGLMDKVSGSFARHNSHRIAVEDPNEDEIGKAIPESVIRQLDAHLDTLGEGVPYGSMTETDVKRMFQTIYLLLRDTGRRPNEIASLHMDCLERIDGDYNLIWNNYKAKRMRRRLPIDSGTVKIIQDWQQHRRQMAGAEHSPKFMFPTATSSDTRRHIRTGAVSNTIRAWVNAMDRLDSEVPDAEGRPLPFDRSLIYPYAFRHSYAQRHADAGTPLDVLKDLMDHKDAKTTMGYYKVTLKRKRDAVKTMRPHVVDRSGRPAPMASNTAYERRSVAVPFGGCVEPSNVKAGGHACPIRFQCAGCGFYRPDPSYLPAIEDHIRSLKADRETAAAMDSEEWVVRNLSDQVAAFKDVAGKMKAVMDQLSDEERTEIEEASKILRKTRAVNGRTLLPLSVVRRGESSA
ncbi:integrase [Streptomyces sp. 2333.5]|uniref:tyrosine-type recombinase/integrase n=1 Tax=unclassified Streptomyces TaxID=2593676 RepID=UPI00089CC8E1|nr:MULTISPECIES: site-specific integrase [unclassified Streptomyces]PJJ03471.1 integrase [Streptomyces sp. 2333.5]SEE46834.1 Integrase [Streptomyces sp. 2112.2]